jgi:flagellar biogenesis protein FliO
MNIKHRAVIGTAILAFPILAHAEAQAASGESSGWGNLFWGIFPIILLVAIFIPIIRRMQKPIIKRSQDHMARQVQHMERVEQSLDRIIKLLEKKD